MSAEKAFDYYIALDGFKLVYETNNTYTYTADEAKTLMYDYNYNKDTEIRLVYRTDIYPNYISPFNGKQLDYEGKEYKDANVTYNYSDISGLSQERNIKLLADFGIGFSGGSFVPNKATKFTIQILNYEKVAQIKGIYNIDFKDKAFLSEEYMGYAALAHGLGLVKADANNEFRPTASLTRAEAADMLIALMFAR
ncbi:MAG: S-layer domain protein [Anaerocolumna sp.]|nr:S-layer domain protein [Anaerocolumna sp.]